MTVTGGNPFDKTRLTGRPTDQSGFPEPRLAPYHGAMRRRDFLRTPPTLESPGLPRHAPGELSLIRVSRRAMATTFEVALPFGTPDALAAAEDALDVIDAVEDQLTVYRDSSEVARLNADAFGRSVPVAANLFDLLTQCAEWTRDTAGGFDIAVGALVASWAAHKREGRIPPPADLANARANSGMRHVMLDAQTRSVKYRFPQLSLNFGSVGKGYALDLAAELLRNRWGIGSALLHGGGSSVRALGTPPGHPRGWPVAVTHPSGSGTLGTVYLRDEGMGTSAATFQFFEVEGRRYGHVIDPRSGSPATGTESASVVAPTAAQADALSTAFFVQGADAAIEYIQPRPALLALMLRTDRPTAETITSPPGTR